MEEEDEREDIYFISEKFDGIASVDKDLNDSWA